MTALHCDTWTAVCHIDDVQSERAVAALVRGEQIAVVRTFDGTLHAVGNRDPFTGAYVLSRGIVGTRGDRDVLTSPLHKQAFDLATGECLDDPSVRIPVFAVRRTGERVEVRGP